jgi:hypothetical protein
LHRQAVGVEDGNDHKYDTVSYAWGSESHDRPILVDGRVFFVSFTLEAALREFRARDYSNVWVDAICIDQNDVDERNSQVRLMAEIYKQSSRLLLWLGVEEAESDLAMDFLFETWPQIQIEIREHESDTSYIPTVSEYMYFGLHSLLSRNYFQRTWVFQEYVLGGSNICCIIHCGSKAISSDLPEGFVRIPHQDRLWDKDFSLSWMKGICP